MLIFPSDGTEVRCFPEFRREVQNLEGVFLAQTTPMQWRGDYMPYGKAFRKSVLWALLLLLLSPSVYADTIKGYEDPSYFGNLTEGALNAGAGACGPAATVNSIVFLQKTYSTFYSKVPLIKLNVSSAALTAEELALGNTLCSDMHCSAANGTNNIDFQNGKINYFKPFTAAGERTTVKAIVGANGNNPSVSTLASLLKKGEDVEILLDFAADNSSHYVTLDDISVNAASNGAIINGTISYIDPMDGGAYNATLNGSVTKYSVNYIEPSNAEGAGNVSIATIFEVFEESPVPEPGSGSLLLIGIVGLLAVRWRRRCQTPATPVIDE